MVGGRAAFQQSRLVLLKSVSSRFAPSLSRFSPGLASPGCPCVSLLYFGFVGLFIAYWILLSYPCFLGFLWLPLFKFVWKLCCILRLRLASLDSLRLPLVSSGFFFVRLASLATFGFLWLSLASFGFLWQPLATFGCLWLPLASFSRSGVAA